MFSPCVPWEGFLVLCYMVTLRTHMRHIRMVVLFAEPSTHFFNAMLNEVMLFWAHLWSWQLWRPLHWSIYELLVSIGEAFFWQWCNRFWRWYLSWEIRWRWVTWYAWKSSHGLLQVHFRDVETFEYLQKKLFVRIKNSKLLQHWIALQLKVRWSWVEPLLPKHQNKK